MMLSPNDWQVWRSLRLAALADSPGAFGSALAEWTGLGDAEQRWRGRLNTVELNVLLTLEDQPAGMVSATAPDREGAVEMISLWVVPFARGHGVGDAALDCVVGWAHAEFGDVSVVLSVKTDNTPAIQLYGRHGFTDAGRPPEFADPRTGTRGDRSSCGLGRRSGHSISLGV
jgi:ribosomal protein S18 acetylase RimI-like enzyme